MAERELSRPRRWTPTRRFARSWWWLYGEDGHHAEIAWDDPRYEIQRAIDDRVDYFEYVPRKLARLIRVLAQEARDDEELGYVGVAVVESAGMSQGQESVEAVYRARLDARSRDLVLGAVYPNYRSGTFGYVGPPFP